MAGGAFDNDDFSYVNWQEDFPNVCDLPINYKEAFVAALGMIKSVSMFTDYRVILLFVQTIYVQQMFLP